MKIIIEATKSRGCLPVLLMHVPKTNESITTHLSVKDYKKFQKGNLHTQMDFVMEAFKDIFTLMDVHEKSLK